MNIKFLCRLFVSALGLLCVVAWTKPVEMDIIDSQLDDQEEIIRERIPTVVTLVNPVYNPAVRSYLNTYIYSRPDQTAAMLGWAAYYFPKFEKALTEEGLPTDLKYLAIVESALNPNAVSRSGASGLWQFMKPTAKECGLKCGSYIDERMDPEKSSKAAASYLKQLYTMFGNWELVMAAYNAGPGRVKTAVKKAGTSDYWELSKYLPAETQSYVPGFIAASYIMNFHNEHNLVPDYPEHAMGELTSIVLHQGMSISEIAVKSGLTIDLVKGLNPTFVRNYIPASQNGYVIWLPMASAELFNSGRVIESSLVNIDADANTESRTLNVNGVLYSIITVRKNYLVRPGDNLYTIAQRNSCSVKEIMSWNTLHDTHLAIGQRLEFIEESRELVPVMVEETAAAPPVRNDQTLIHVPSLGFVALLEEKPDLSVNFSIEARVPEETSDALVLKRRQCLRQALGSSEMSANVHISQVIMPGTAVAGDVVRVRLRT